MGISPGRGGPASIRGNQVRKVGSVIFVARSRARRPSSTARAISIADRGISMVRESPAPVVRRIIIRLSPGSIDPSQAPEVTAPEAPALPAAPAQPNQKPDGQVNVPPADAGGETIARLDNVI